LQCCLCRLFERSHVSGCLRPLRRMSSMASTRSCAIIGVVGRTFGAKDLDANGDLPIPDRDLLQLAQDVGQQIAAHKHVVLTGGHHKNPEKSVKYRALVGATQVSPARVIGILPASISEAVEVKPVAAYLKPNEPALRCLYVHTGLPSDKRDRLTGNAVDALIALRGKSGTPREVDAALAADPPRPVVFLNSWDVLQPLLSRPPTILLLAKTTEEAVTKALNAVGLRDSPTPRLEGCFPPTFDEYPDPHTYPNLKIQYQQQLPQLCS
jgi:predicted Rossmann-fold nucleotide-binding protein